MADYVEIVKGTVVDREGARPIPGAQVRVFDKDLLVDDHLGTTTTDDNGRFRVEFSWSQYKDSAFEGRPDIYLEVGDPASGSTKRSKVFTELKGKLTSDDVEVMDLGQVEVD